MPTPPRLPKIRNTEFARLDYFRFLDRIAKLKRLTPADDADIPRQLKGFAPLIEDARRDGLVEGESGERLTPKGRAWLRAHQPQRRGAQSHSVEWLTDVLCMLREGLTQAQIAEQLDEDPPTISKAVRELRKAKLWPR